MNVTGQIESAYLDAFSGDMKLIVSVKEKGIVANCLDKLKGQLLNMSFDKFHRKRSRDANALMWACLGEISAALNTDKWEVYLMMLKRYGKYTHILVNEAAVEATRSAWRESEIVGEVNVNGRKAVQLLCYYGSSQMDSKEFSRLLTGIISEMEEMGLEAPTSTEMKRALEAWEKKKNEVNNAE